ncbi:hypothetical protein C8Q74DRAFT_824616 [Fomes fomentarius]|nr:hypothetical protein C8Q74DRAFT_824616 [Fomes fomentarius]
MAVSLPFPALHAVRSGPSVAVRPASVTHPRLTRSARHARLRYPLGLPRPTSPAKIILGASSIYDSPLPSIRPVQTKHSSECQRLVSVSVRLQRSLVEPGPRHHLDRSIHPSSGTGSMTRSCGNDGWHIPSIMLLMPHKLRIHTYILCFWLPMYVNHYGLSDIAMLQPDSQFSKSLTVLVSTPPKRSHIHSPTTRSHYVR